MGYTRKDRMMNGMWPKSAIRYGSRVETTMLRLGVGVGKTLLSNGKSSSRGGNGSSSPLSTLSYSNESDVTINKKNAVLWGIVFLALAVGSQIAGYISYRENDVLPFLYLLCFASISLISLFGALVSLCQIENAFWYKFLGIAIILGGLTIITLMTIPLFSDNDAGIFTVLLFVFQLFFIAIGVLVFYEERKKKRQEREDDRLLAMSAVSNTAPKRKSTSRTKRIEEMESRYDRVKAVLDEIKTSENKLSNLTDDIEALREYYESGKWQKDFKADEQGKLPANLKRGVLSEDGLFDMFNEIETHL